MSFGKIEPRRLYMLKGWKSKPKFSVACCTSGLCVVVSGILLRAGLPHQHLREPAGLPLLCSSRQGSQNACQIITQCKLRGNAKLEGAATFDNLHQYAAGLICLTGRRFWSHYSLNQTRIRPNKAPWIRLQPADAISTQICQPICPAPESNPNGSNPFVLPAQCPSSHT